MAPCMTGRQLPLGSVVSTVLRCSMCGCEYTMPALVERDRRLDGQTFLCPNGHQQYFPQVNHVGVSTAEEDHEQLQKLLDRQERRLERMQEDLKRRLHVINELRQENGELQEEYKKSRRCLGGVAGDRNTYKKLATEAMEETKHLRLEVQKLTRECEELRLALAGLTSASSEDRDMRVKAVQAQFFEGLIAAIWAQGGPKGITNDRLEQYLRDVVTSSKLLGTRPG